METENAVREVEREIFAAIKNRDVNALDAVIADDFIYRAPAGRRKQTRLP